MDLVRDGEAPPIRTLTYEVVLAAKSLPAAAYFFTDIDLLATDARIKAARIYRRLAEEGCPVFNDPATVKSRYGLLRTLHLLGLNPINAYLAEEETMPGRFPVFIRIKDGHLTLPISDPLPDQATLDRAIDAAVEAGTPLQSILIVEYAAEPIRPGIFRKLSVFRLGDLYLPHPCVHDVTWPVKYGRRGSATPELYEEELQIMRDNRYAERLRPQFEAGNIDYGRADFGEVGGQLCTYEINSNPLIRIGIPPHSSPQRKTTYQLWVDVLRDALWSVERTTPSDSAEISLAGTSLAALSKAVDRFPNLKRGFHLLSLEQLKRGQFDAALRSVEEAIDREPEIPEILLTKARVLLAMGRATPAIEAVQAAVTLVPEDPKIKVRAAKILARGKQLDEALAIARDSQRADPRSVRAHLVTAEILNTLGDVGGATAAAEEAVSIDPSDEAAEAMLIKLCSRKAKADIRWSGH